VTIQADSTAQVADLPAEITAVPYHIGIIMDGNGRWAQARGMPRIAGHQAGVDNIQRILEHCVRRGVKVLTIYAFSTENWRRPPDEVSGLMRLLGLTIQRQLNELNRNGVRILHSGRMEGINKHLQKQFLNAL
jgi:undecaprenyl diphosphate synthase